MTPSYVYNVWAPPQGPWSAWAKPVLFAHVNPLAVDAGEELARVDVEQLRSADGSTAIVLDLPGKIGVASALSLAIKGYRPVPLYNAVPLPVGSQRFSDQLTGVVACDVTPIIQALGAATPAIDRLNLSFDAPPAFMLDADRRLGTGAALTPGMFDNRSVSLPTDFPSANLMLSRGIGRVILVQMDSIEPQPDLAHTLLRWQEAGIEILALRLAHPHDPLQIRVTRPPLFRRLWQRVAATMGLRRSPLGGFGGMIPIPSSSGG